MIRGIKSRRMKWAGHVVHTGREEMYTGFLCGNRRERDQLEDLGEEGQTMLIFNFQK
jgi:hypothetical protein